MQVSKAVAQSSAHPDEIYALFQYKKDSSRGQKAVASRTIDSNDPDLKFCYKILVSVSRSFAGVIQQLPEEMRDAICVFYLVLRGLDTIEDDTRIPAETRVKDLRRFHECISQPGFCYKGAGKGDEEKLLLEFSKVVAVFNKLKPGYQEVIRDIAKGMGNGMADFIEKPVDTFDDYKLYCHYVAGLVGHGLSRIFASSKLESPRYATAEGLRIANSMGLFLQMVNIIRDYLEDLVDNRLFWPKQIWSKYTNDIASFRKPENKAQAMNCMNELVAYALELIPDCMEYLRGLTNLQVFRFCAIPQVMAISTLAALYQNYDPFTRVVKIRRGLTAKMFVQCNNMSDVYGWFDYFLSTIESQLTPSDPNLKRVTAAIAAARKSMELPGHVVTTRMSWSVLFLLFALLFAFYSSVAAPTASSISINSLFHCPTTAQLLQLHVLPVNLVAVPLYVWLVYSRLTERF
mmetsp:Transcript_19712/g.33846  ORF Transcript_19712/g.33846 Transcript_19712/m.33846 type:complete len:460 (+) Transcript_19712:25-1404(+)